jgi:carboxylesterase
LTKLQLFQAEEHRTFHWPGGRPAALLVHGFPGTPAELRPLGKSLHRAGWTVSGPLLPGFGPQIQTLSDRDALEWVTAVHHTLVELAKKHTPVLLVGYSMGAALAAQAAAVQSPDGLVLLAPFQRLGSRWQHLVGFLLKPFFRRIQPFRRADFSDPDLRRNIADFLGGVNVDDPEVQQSLRELTVSTRVFEQVNRVGQNAYRLAAELGKPTLVIQGTQDEVVSFEETRTLLSRLSSPIHYLEVTAGHNLLDPVLPAWSQVEYTVLEFADSLAEEKYDG